MYFLMQSYDSAALTALILFLVASATDFFDGYFARKYNVVSTLGKLLDPLADKLLITAVLVIMVSTNEVSAVLVMIVLAREFAVTGLRSIAASESIIIPASKFGKLKTVTQILALSALIFTRIAENYHVWSFASQTLFYIAVFATVLSGLDYFYKASTIFKTKSY